MPNTWLSFLVLTILIAYTLPNVASAHGGGLDAQGCHNDRKHGNYHCHRPQPTQTSNISKKIKLSYKPIAKKGCSCAAQKFCTGPRGGVYCINGSGNKSYRR